MKIGIAYYICSSYVKLAFVCFWLFEEHFDGWEHFEDNVADELIFFIILQSVKLVHFWSQHSQNIPDFDVFPFDSFFTKIPFTFFFSLLVFLQFFFVLLFHFFFFFFLLHEIKSTLVYSRNIVEKIARIQGFIHHHRFILRNITQTHIW